MKRFIAAAVVAVVAASAACWSDPATTIGRAHLVVAFIPLGGSGSYTARINDQTFATPGQFAVELTSLDPTYEISGTFSYSGIRIAFSTSTTAGVQAESLVNVSGPVAQVGTCSIAYVNEGSGTQSFRMQFRLTGTIDRACR